jgi:phosphatidylglycerophosphatase A
MNDKPSATPATGKKTLWAWTVATFFGVGLLKPGPGTWGSVVAVLLWMSGIVIHQYNPFPFREWQAFWLFYCSVTLAAAVLVSLIGIPAATIVAQQFGREDPGFVVIDEVAGQLLTLAACKPNGPHALVALALFRLFDITKPWPIRKLEALPGGWGIMLDDLGAGAFGAVVLLAIQHWW